MTVANRYVGKDLYATFVCAAGTIVLTGDQRSLSVDREIDLADVTAGADTDKSYIATIKDGSAEIEIMDQAGVGATDFETAMPEGTSGTLIYGPQGTVAGKPKRGFAAFVKSISVEYPYSDAVTYRISFQKNGALLYGGTSVYP